MPIIGEVSKGTAIGRVKGIYCWLLCDICHKPRWVELYKGTPRRTICHSCSVKNSNKIRLRYPPYTHGNNPRVGDIAKASDLGKQGTARFIYHTCIDCGKRRWVMLNGNQPKVLRCHRCSVNTLEHKANLRAKAKTRIGSQHSRWRGGKRLVGGYVEIWLPANDFFAPMANKHHYVAEHRLIMAKSLGRCLLPWEVVHHKNGIRNDNRAENLELLPTAKYHIADCIIKSRIKYLANRVALLESELTSNGIPLPTKTTTKTIIIKTATSYAEMEMGCK